MASKKSKKPTAAVAPPPFVDEPFTEQDGDVTATISSDKRVVTVRYGGDDSALCLQLKYVGPDLVIAQMGIGIQFSLRLDDEAQELLLEHILDNNARLQQKLGVV